MICTAGVELQSRLYIWVMFIVAPVTGCNPILPKLAEPNITFWEAIQQAQPENVDGRVELPETQTSSKIESARHVVRALTGTTVTIPCSQPYTNPMLTKQDGESLFWRYEDRAESSTTLNTSDFLVYSIRSVNSTSYMSINVTAFSGGNIECLHYCRNKALCTVKEFVLKLKLRPSDVFIGQMQNVSNYYVYGVRFTCTVNSRCCPNPDEHFIWKLDGRFAYYPKCHMVGRFLHLQPGYQPWSRLRQNYSCEYQNFCQQSLELSVNLARGHPDRGNVECWVRPDPTTEEWIVQKAVYHFLWRKNTTVPKAHEV